ncbi:MAG: hypothetical protein J5833_08000 [Victivallales bacterium]|nr:hypothetical protein [Victivallales bacterium]
MSNLIETTPISGFKVYGQQMVDYKVQGTSGQDFGTAIAIAALAESSAIEVEATAYGSVLRARQKKQNELGDALAIVSKAISTMKTGSGQKSTDKSEADSRLNNARTILNRYGVYDLPVDKDDKVQRGDAEKARSNAEYAMDVENNDMQQDMITLQGLISKRDNSFSTAAKVLKKIDSTGDSIIRSIGG